MQPVCLNAETTCRRLVIIIILSQTQNLSFFRQHLHDRRLNRLGHAFQSRAGLGPWEMDNLVKVDCPPHQAFFLIPPSSAFY